MHVFRRSNEYISFSSSRPPRVSFSSVHISILTPRTKVERMRGGKEEEKKKDEANLVTVAYPSWHETTFA